MIQCCNQKLITSGEGLSKDVGKRKQNDEAFITINAKTEDNLEMIV